MIAHIDINKQLIRFNAKWGMTGNVIVCTRCMHHQCADDADKPFVHALDCRNAGIHHPWSELYSILAMLPRNVYSIAVN